jgi:hypothetical protein
MAMVTLSLNEITTAAGAELSWEPSFGDVVM